MMHAALQYSLMRPSQHGAAFAGGAHVASGSARPRCSSGAGGRQGCGAATVTDDGALLVPAAAVGAVLDAAPGDVVQVRIVRPSRKQTNMYGALADQPLDLDPEDLATVREQMWASFGADDEP